VLLLHGQPGSARDWDRVIAALAERDAQARAIAVDRPGWDGRSPAGGLALSATAAVAALDAAGAERATVVGLSFGGAVAAWLAAEHPERVAAQVLVSPAANLASIQPVDRLLAAPLAGYLISAALMGGAAAALSARWVRRRLEAGFALPDEYLLAAARRLRSPAAWESFVVEQRALLRDLPDLEARLSRISVPTTIVLGTADTIVPVASGRRLAAQIPGAELVEIDGGHHVLPAEHPARLAEIILAARSGAPGARAARSARGAAGERPDL
jgi:pimeloyl-ACP methyl ester carboxylesterase